MYDLRRDLADSVTEAVLLFNQALRKAAELGRLLEAAQAAISEQGYRSRPAKESDAAVRASHHESDRR